MIRHDGRINGSPSTRRDIRSVDLTPHLYKNVRWEHVCRPCVRREIDRQEGHRKENQRKITVRELKNLSNVKPKYEYAGFDNYYISKERLNNRPNAKMIYSQEEIRNINRVHGIVKEWAHNFKESKRSGKFITLLGNPGTGKTHLACAAINHVIEKECRKCLIMNVQTIFMNIKQIYSQKGNELALLEKMANLDLLVIEEVGIQKDSDWEFEKLNWIISERVDRLNPTIVISNLDAEDFQGVIGSRMWDRLCGEDNETLMFDWRSFR